MHPHNNCGPMGTSHNNCGLFVPQYNKHDHVLQLVPDLPSLSPPKSIWGTPQMDQAVLSWPPSSSWKLPTGHQLFPPTIDRHLAWNQLPSMVFVWAPVAQSLKFLEWFTFKCWYLCSSRQSYAFQQSDMKLLPGAICFLVIGSRVAVSRFSTTMKKVPCFLRHSIALST